MIYIAAPAYNNLSPNTAKALLRVQNNFSDVIINIQDYSALTLNFNMMWFDMLNKRRQGLKIEYFVMIHSDIDVIEETDWLHKLVNIMSFYTKTKSLNLDVLSVVSPLKDDKGLTSTGIYSKEKDAVIRRITMKELRKLPGTFNIWDCWSNLGLGSGCMLVVNTGLMLVKVADWCEKVFFRTRDTVLKITDKETGLVQFYPQFYPEDWLFSLDVQSLGCQIAATQAIAIDHIGKKGYPNYKPWGELETDNLQHLIGEKV